MDLAIARDEYDFLDFGASHGGYIDFIRKALGYRKGLGIDNDRSKVAYLRERDYDVTHANLLTLDIPRKCVKLVTISHTLEHLPNMKAVQSTLNKAMCAARNGVLVEGPWFESDDYLARHGLKFCWSDWHGHPTHVRIQDVLDVLDGKDFKCHVLADAPVTTSADPRIVALSSPQDQKKHNPAYPKKIVALSGVHANFAVYAFRNIPEARQWSVISKRRQFFPYGIAK